jgi:hypothetical protein|tara:strand:- start:319 stop:1197 length:879 start_codon:yes stop_codon:yes gene_type:complete
MILEESLNNYWNSLEKKYPLPSYVKKVKELDFRLLKKAIDDKNITFLKKLIRNMYLKKEAYILKYSADKKLKETIIGLANSYKKSKESTFFKMLDGTPNFHRVIDKKITKKYSLFAIKHSFYFYNWNIRSKLEKKLKNGVYKHWRYVKLLAGNKKTKFEKNIPSDGQIDRLQIVRYPAGGGELRDHVDPRKNQRVVSGIIMSKLGKDFQKGGFYFKSSKKKKINIEKKLDEGDAVIFYGSIAHGVEKVDPKEKLSWKSNKGRWFIGMFVNDSDHVKNRVTAKDLTSSVKNYN